MMSEGNGRRVYDPEHDALWRAITHLRIVVLALLLALLIVALT